MTLAKLYPLSKCNPKYILKVILITSPISVSEFPLALEMLNLWFEGQRLSLKFMAS